MIVRLLDMQFIFYEILFYLFKITVENIKKKGVRFTA